MGAHGQEWFNSVFETNARAIFRYFARRAPADDVEDLSAEVFAIAWRRRESVPDGAELAWLYRTAGFVLANYRRKEVPTPVEQLPDGSVGSDDTDPLLGLIRDEQVREAMTKLSPRDRAILVAVAWDGLSGDGLAHALGITRGGADAALSRARARLTEAWVA